MRAMLASIFRWFAQLADPFMPYGRDLPPADPWRFILHQLRPLRLVVAMSLVLTLLGAAIEVWLIFYAGHLVDSLAATTPALLWQSHGLELLGALALVLVVRPAAGFLREALDDIAFRPNAETLVRWRAHRHVLGQSVGWFRSDLAGRILTQVQAAGTAATGAAYSVLHTLSFVAVYVVGSVFVMAAVDGRLVLPLLAWIGLYAGLVAYAVPRYRRASAHLQEAGSALTGNMVDAYANIDTVKLFANPAEDDRESRRIFGAFRRTFIGVQRIEVTINGAMLALSSLLMVGLIGTALLLWQAGGAPLGLIAAALALSYRITGMAEWLLDAVSSLFGHLGTLREALKTVAVPLTIADAPDARELVVRGGAIRFNDVTHHYGREQGGLEHLSLNVGPGERVGLVGLSGAGKSTMLNLLLRFYEPESGTIEIDRQDIARVTQESLRRRIAMVTQDVALLHRSVRDNIAYGSDGVSDEAIAAAARRAAADRFIPLLADAEGNHGYNALVGERGVTLSGGQRQRIALARAILKDAPILLLDEATSALDSEVEAAIRDTLYEVMEGKTVIAIAHRLSTIAHMDRIVVIENGRIAEEGAHDALLGQRGIYFNLWERQAGGFIGASE
ncbi:MAG: ABC transporter ATP-binding protein [Devosia sp.]